MNFTVEQQNFIDNALKGKNVLVDACVGSGKTTAIQQLCTIFPKNKRILYLTYNKLLKIDAKEKIKGKNVTVTNYHGFAYSCLIHNGIKAGLSDLIQVFLSEKPDVGKYDLLVLDEYQDIDQEISEMLTYIKECNPRIQIVAVGDMRQKIYDKTTLRIEDFIEEFIGIHEDVEFTQCFRLSADIAEKLGRVWGKKIIGKNPNCKVTYLTKKEIVDFLSDKDPKDILCLGARTGIMADVLNTLEEKYRETYNKKTVYASIADNDRTGATEPSNETAIFTTFDSSKGLERKICVVFDFTESYWAIRRDMPEQKYEILRNIFCVAASRGKEQIVFVQNNEELLSEQSLSTPGEINHKFKNMQISHMFDFKYREDIEECYRLLTVKRIERDDLSVIEIENHDDLIDLSPCIGIYQEAFFFTKYDIDKDIELYKIFNPDEKVDASKYETLDEKILYLTSLETKQKRYRKQVSRRIVGDKQRKELKDRLSEVFTENDDSQKICEIQFSKTNEGKFEFSAGGYADVIKNNIVYELKFAEELCHEHFLQCACYMVARKINKGILWNVRTNEMYEVYIRDRKRFLDCVVKTITKHQIEKYYKVDENVDWLEKDVIRSNYFSENKTTDYLVKLSKEKDLNMIKRFAVLDTETNWDDKVMSIGIVIADADTFDAVDERYCVLDPEYIVGGMFSSTLFLKGRDNDFFSREDAIELIENVLKENEVNSIFAYNASFDKKHLPELEKYNWYDIMKIAAYRQYNPMIPENAACFGTGRLKKNYGVEAMIRMISEQKDYMETHNALLDAHDELCIMKILEKPLEDYNCAMIHEGFKNSNISNASFKKVKKKENTKKEVKEKIDILGYKVQVCFACMKKFKVSRNIIKKVKCPTCNEGYLLDINMDYEEWKALDKDVRDKIADKVVSEYKG